jgi:hypothetical protein
LRWPSAPCRSFATSAGVALALALAPAAATTPATAATQARPQTGLDVIDLTIETAAGKRHSYRVEVAATPRQQATGMMFRKQVPKGTGMLFPFAPPRPAAFYMRNTLVALDLVFIGADGRVRNIVADAVPLSETPLPSLGPVAAVLELAGGEAARIGLAPGDRVRW